MSTEPIPSYEAPAVRVVGTVADITQAGHPSGYADANYNIGEALPPGGAGDGSKLS